MFRIVYSSMFSKLKDLLLVYNAKKTKEMVVFLLLFLDIGVMASHKSSRGIKHLIKYELRS